MPQKPVGNRQDRLCKNIDRIAYVKYRQDYM